MREIKSVPSEVKADGTTPGRWRQTFSVFNNVDEGGDRVVHGAFKRTLEENGLPPVIWSHQWSTPPIGQSLDAQEKRGKFEVLYQLFVREGEDHPVARMVDASLAGGALKEGSFGYEAVKTKDVEEDGETVRELHDVDLYEVSPTLVGMNRATRGQVEAASLEATIALAQDPAVFEELSKSIARHIWEFSNSGVKVGTVNTSGGNTTFNLDPAKSITEHDEVVSQVDEEPEGQVDEELASKIALAKELLALEPR